MVAAPIFAPKGPFVTDLPNAPGLSTIDPKSPAAPFYEMLARLRSPVTLRELMIEPVRTGYIGKPGETPAKALPPSAASLYPQIKVEEIGVPSADGLIRCQVFSPPGGDMARSIVLYIHGGGFMVGQSEDTAPITSCIAAETGCLVVSVNYRLAPEWPFPYGLEDSFAVLAWLTANAASLGGDKDRIAVAGDSSGANFAAVLPLMARDRGVRVPRAALLLCPVTDFFFESYASFERLAPLGIVYDAAFIGFARNAYLPRASDWPHPYASPARADLQSYPPAMVVSGGDDPLLDDNRAFVEKLRAAGTEVTWFERSGMPHGYYFFPGLMPEGDEALRAAAAFLKERM